jgi:RNA polymerase sigma-70 factor (ECF subfamily)
VEAWNRFYGECDPVIRRFAGRFARRGIDVEECVQDTWVDLVRSLRYFRLDQRRGRFTSWLYSIVRNKAADQIRRTLRRPALSLSDAACALPEIDSDPARQVVRADELRALDEALRKLRSRISAISYSVLHLRHLEGRSVRETADALGLTSQQVWTMEHRAKDRLRRMLTIRSVVRSQTCA